MVKHAKPKRTWVDDQVTRIEGYLTKNQVLAMFGISEVTLYKWRDRLGMPYIEIPGDDRSTIRYDLDELVAWAEEAGKEYDTAAVRKKSTT